MHRGLLGAPSGCASDEQNWTKHCPLRNTTLDRLKRGQISFRQHGLVSLRKEVCDPFQDMKTPQYCFCKISAFSTLSVARVPSSRFRGARQDFIFDIALEKSEEEPRV